MTNPTPAAAAVLALAERVEAASGPDRLKFALHPPDRGYVVSGRRDTIELLCALWNHRGEIAAALRARAQQEQSA